MTILLYDLVGRDADRPFSPHCWKVKMALVLAAAFAATHERPARDLPRWFLEEPIHQNGRTWVLSNQWGSGTAEVLEALAGLSPGFGFHPAGDSQPQSG